jgi:hypothetical protein
MAEEKSTTVEHPLLRRAPVRKPDSWNHWLARWNDSTVTNDELLGLLHGGMSYRGRPAVHVANVCFYLEVADGFEDESNFDGRLGDSSDDWKMLRDLARKAFKVLCHNFFRNTTEWKSNLPSWAGLIANPAVFERVLCFLGRRNSYGRLQNVPDKFAELAVAKEEVETFIPEFCWFVLKNGYSAAVEGVPVKPEYQMFFDARPRILEIMDGARCLHLLLQNETVFAYPALFLDDASMAKLEELAMANRQGEGEKKYGSLQEAIYAGSKAASVFALLEVKHRERERQKKLKRAKELEKEARQLVAAAKA